jgi:hypothetical protein
VYLFLSAPVGQGTDLGHRTSVDFDFFARRPIDLPQLENDIPFLAGANIIQRERNTLSAIVDRGDPVKVSFFGVPKLPQLAPAHIIVENNLKVASMLDLAASSGAKIPRFCRYSTIRQTGLPGRLSAIILQSPYGQNCEAGFENGHTLRSGTGRRDGSRQRR